MVKKELLQTVRRCTCLHCRIYIPSYAGTGKRSDNDTSFVTEKFETTELNNGKILGTHIDKDGGFNVGDVLFVNQETGDVEFKSVDFDFPDIASINN